MTKLSLAVVLGLVVGIGSAGAQSYPSRPITMIAPFPAGGPSDALARILSEPMRAALGQPVVIENVAGAGGNIGVGRLALGARRLHRRHRPMEHPRRQCGHLFAALRRVA
jgi:tripartite-type tricarboxylate transporter receptor subunit TctC